MQYEDMDCVIDDMTKTLAMVSAEEEVKQILSTLGQMNLHIHLTDLDGWMTQVIANNELKMLPGQVGEAAVCQHMDSETFVKLMTGAEPPPMLALAGKIRIDGNFLSVVVLQPLLVHINKAYNDVIATH